MSEATGSGRAEMKRRLIERSLEDEAFRQRLLEDPKGAIEQELGMRVPEDVQIRAVEETPDTIYLVLPGTSPVGQGGEISDRDLESVAGGGGTEGGEVFDYSPGLQGGPASCVIGPCVYS